MGTATSGDTKLAYSVEGDGKETVLLVMGLGGRASDWGTAFPDALAEKYRVVRFDNRGVGASPMAPGGYVLSDLARDATAVLDAVSADKAHVIGVSMGGMISQLVALEHPARVNKLVLLSTNFGGVTLEPPHPDAMRLFDPGEFIARVVILAAIHAGEHDRPRSGPPLIVADDFGDRSIGVFDA